MSETPESPAEPTPDEEPKPTAPSASPSPPGGASATGEPLPGRTRFDPGSVLWTAIWSAVLALGVAAGATTWERIETRANERALLLLPSTESSEADREQWLEHLLEDLNFESGEWLSPKDLVQQVSATVPSEMWGELFSESDAWLPWLLRMRPADPLEDIPAFKAQLEDLRNDPRFRLALYDEAALERDANQYALVRRATFIAAGVLALLGALALLLSPFTTRWLFDVPLGAVLAAGLTGLGWYGLLRAGVAVDREQGLRALATALTLAGLIGPMLKGRITQIFWKARQAVP